MHFFFLIKEVIKVFFFFWLLSIKRISIAFKDSTTLTQVDVHLDEK